MAKVSGLTTLQTNNAPRNRKQGREGRNRQVNRQVSLRPNASPGQYYRKPAEGQVGVQARQVADALANVSPTLGKLSSFMADKQRKEAEQQAQSELQQLTIEEAKQKVSTGEMSEYENPYFQEAFQRQYGVRLGLHEGRKLAVKFSQSYDPRQGDVEQFIAENLEADIEGIQQNPLVEGGFSDAMEETLVKIRDSAAERTAETYQQDKLDGVYETFDAEISRRLESAQTKAERDVAVQEAYQAIRSHYPENKELLNLSNNDQDVVLMQVAARHAREGNVDVVEKLLTDNRDGVGAIIDKRGKQGAEASSILSKAISNFESDNRQRTFEKRMDFFHQSQAGQLDEDELVSWHQENPGALTDPKVQALIRANRSSQEQTRRDLQEQQNTAAIRSQQDQERSDMITAGLEAVLNGQAHRMGNMVVTNDQGEQEILEGEDVIKETEQYILNEWADSQVAEEENPGEAKFNLLMEIYSKNSNLTNDEWKDTLANPSGSLSLAAAAGSEEDIPPKLTEGYNLYKRIKARNPGMLNSLELSADDKDVYESMRIAETYMGLSTKQAVEQAYKLQSNSDIDENPSIRARYDEVDTAVANLNGFLDGWGKIQNDSYVGTELRKIGRFIARAGGPTGLNEAVKRFKEEHAFVNGWAVPVRGNNVPDNFKQLAEAKIQKYVEDHPDEGLQAEDISVFPISGDGNTGVWSLVDHTTASPLEDRQTSQFTLRDLQNDFEQQRTEALEESVEAANESKDNVRPSIPEDMNWRG